MLVVHLHVDCGDAMGANIVNTMCEALAPTLAEWVGGRPGLRILSNVIGCPPEQVQAGMRVRVEFRDTAGDVSLPVFRPV